MKYLILDKNDITKLCGSIERSELKKELGFSDSQLKNFIDHNNLYKEKYILIEDDKKESKKRIDKYELLFHETSSGKKYYASNDGLIYVLYKNGEKKYLNGYLKKQKSRTYLVIKVGDKSFVAKNLIASLFIREYKPNDTVILKDDDPRNISVENLIVIDKASYSRMTGHMARSQRVGLFEDNKCIKSFRSAREAGRKLYCSYQTVNDYCNNKVKKKEFDLRWI